MILSKKNQYFGRSSGVVLRLVFAITFFATAAFGHAKMLRSEPSNGEKLGQTPPAIVLNFSAQLQATEINSIVVTDASGRRVDKNIVALTADGKKLSAALEETAAGVLKVEWKALSADDHLMKGEFSFTVAAPNTPATTAAATPTPTTNAPQISETAPPNVETQSAPAEKSGTNPLQSLVRWLAYLALMTLFGGFAFSLSVLDPSLENARNLSDADKLKAFVIARKKFVALSYLSLSLLFSAALAALILQTSTVLEISLAQAITPSNLWKVLTQTAYGVPWFLQIAAMLAVLIVIVLIGKRKNDAPPQAAFGGKPLFWTGLIFSALLLATLSLTGHARAAQKDYAFAVVSDWVHLVAAGIWVGGIFQLALVLPKTAGAVASRARISLLAPVIARFSALAVAATALLALTGIYNSWIHLTSYRDLITTPYGITLTVKILLFLLMMPLGAFNRFFIRPRVEKLAAEPESSEHSKTVKDFYFVMILETAFAVAILLLAAILAFLPHSAEHHAAREKAPDHAAFVYRND